MTDLLKKLIKAEANAIAEYDRTNNSIWLKDAAAIREAIIAFSKPLPEDIAQAQKMVRDIPGAADIVMVIDRLARAGE